MPASYRSAATRGSEPAEPLPEGLRPWTFRRWLRRRTGTALAGALALALLVVVVLRAAETPVRVSIVTFAGVALVWALRRRIHLAERRLAEVVVKAGGLIKEGKHEDAATLVEDIAGELLAEPSPRLHADAVFYLARTLKASGEVARARALFESLYEGRWLPDRAILASRIADLAIYQGDAAAARRWLDIAAPGLEKIMPLVADFLECMLVAREGGYAECAARLESLWPQFEKTCSAYEMKPRILLRAFVLHQLARPEDAPLLRDLIASARPLEREQVAAQRAAWPELDAFCATHSLP